jgi:hypothetical protein
VGKEHGPFQLFGSFHTMEYMKTASQVKHNLLKWQIKATAPGLVASSAINKQAGKSLSFLFLKTLAFFGIRLYFSEWIFLFFAVVAFVQQNNLEAGDARR